MTTYGTGPYTPQLRYKAVSYEVLHTVSMSHRRHVQLTIECAAHSRPRHATRGRGRTSHSRTQRYSSQYGDRCVRGRVLGPGTGRRADADRDADSICVATCACTALYACTATRVSVSKTVGIIPKRRLERGACEPRSEAADGMRCMRSAGSRRARATGVQRGRVRGSRRALHPSTDRPVR